MALGVACWAWFFVLAPARSFKVGVEVEDLPVFFKMGGFKLSRYIFLGLFIFVGWAAPIDPVKQLDTMIFNAGDVTAIPLAIGLTLFVLFLFPYAVAGARQRKGVAPGAWRTPMLALYAWTWLGVVILFVLGIPQAWFPPLTDVVGQQLDINVALGLSLGGGLFYLAWWGLPGASVSRKAAVGDAHALSDLPAVRWWGFPSWVSHLFTTPRNRRIPEKDASGKDRKFCPSCMRAIDNIDDYASLDFDHCPHCKELIPAAYALKDYIVHCAAEAAETRSLSGGKGRAAKRASKIEEDLVQRILRGILTFGVRSRATDIHVVNDSSTLLVRMRIDGVLQTIFTLSQELNRVIISVVKVMANLDISEQRKPQDGSFKTNVDDVRLDVRINTSPTSEGESASLRLIYRHRCLGSIDNLGMTKRARGVLAGNIRHPHGLILVTGPTGSGKSTTLYNSLATITDGQRNIITLEDPIEFKLDGLTQMQVDHRKGFEFASGLRTILRQDPDVIMIGEVRDPETAKMAVDASMTGHLVFTTLHTIDTTTAIGRLHDLGVDPHQHAEALLLIIAQRLVRLICPHCAEEFKVTREELADQGMPGGPAKLLLRRGSGCDHCFHTGYFEREGIYEVLQANNLIKSMIGNRAAPMEIRDEARRDGMRTLLEDGLVKVILGRTTIDELKRVTS
jgi:type II secretory ATPase GspE/PulE/Tfp pilus assembly ATPase PilB-like protein